MILKGKRRATDSWRTRSANDRLKEGWGTRLAWSVVGAVAFHAALILLWPAWSSPLPEQDPEDLELTPLELIALYEQIGGRGGLGGTAAVPVSEIPDSLDTQVNVRESEGGPEMELATMSEALRERLMRVGGLVPTVVEREPEPEPEPQDEASEGGSDTGSIGGSASSTAELSSIPDPSSIDLDRLTAVRPELALLQPSNWVLIRNPHEVEQFIERAYVRGDIGLADEGTVSVALWIDERGRVEWAEINESSGRPLMDEVALELFSEVVAFRPARDEGVPVSRSVVFSLRFPWY